MNATSGTSHKIPRRPVGPQMPSVNIHQASSMNRGFHAPSSPAPDSHESRKNQRLFHNFMKRNHPNRSDDAISNIKPGTPTSSSRPSDVSTKPPSRDHSTGRNPSPLADSEEPGDLKVQLKDQRSLSFRENAGSTLMHGLKNTAKAAGGISKAGSKFFRQNRQAPNHASKDLDSAQNYQPRVINRPLVEQTRLTRIARRLEDSKDKTEFWMPALPWRCIEYRSGLTSIKTRHVLTLFSFLNFNGCEIEGLYRVPGSDREVKVWKQRFDQGIIVFPVRSFRLASLTGLEHDVNLFDEEDLYDVNTVGSLFKAWLRELPDEIFSLSLQEKLSEKYASQEKAPDELREVLSQLPPWNYYLLFAITCHLSLLHAYREKNKMTLHNLFLCVAPALRMNNDCFRWLVGDWRSCWKGCLTESDALKEEYRILDGASPNSDEPKATNEATPKVKLAGENVDTSQPRPGSSSTTTQPLATPPKTRSRPVQDAKPPHLLLGRSKDDTSIPTGNVHRGSDRNNLTPNTATHNRSASQLPELNFPQPISPISLSTPQQ